MRVEKNIRLLEAFTALTNMGFIIPVIVPYYKDRMGLSFNDFMIGEACFAAVVVLLEVPTGWISDVWKRKYTLLAGVIFDFIGYLCLLYGDSLAWAIAGQSIIGIGISLISGTNQALLYDSLLSIGREKEFRKHEGRRTGWMFYSVAGASIVGGLVYTLNPAFPLYLTLMALIGACGAALLMQEPERHKAQVAVHPLKDMIVTAKYALHGHPEVGLIILFAAAMFCSTKLIMWTQQPYYIELGLHESLYGFLMAAGFMIAGMSSHLNHIFEKWIRGLRALLAVWIVAFLVCALSGIAIGLHGVVLLMIGGSCLYGLASPHVSEAINSRVGSERRATIVSTQSLLTNLFFIPLSLGMGWVSEQGGIGPVLLAVDLWILIAGLFLAMIFIRKGGRKKMLTLF